MPTRLRQWSVALLSLVGAYLIVAGIWWSSSPAMGRGEFEWLRAKLVADADNRGPMSRTFVIDSLPGVRIVLPERRLPTGWGHLFQSRMRMGASVQVWFEEKSLSAARGGNLKEIECYGLLVNGETILDFDQFLAGQETNATKARWSGIGLGVVVLVVALGMLLGVGMKGA